MSVPEGTSKAVKKVLIRIDLFFSLAHLIGLYFQRKASKEIEIIVNAKTLDDSGRMIGEKHSLTVVSSCNDNVEGTITRFINCCLKKN